MWALNFCRWAQNTVQDWKLDHTTSKNPSDIIARRNYYPGSTQYEHFLHVSLFFRICQFYDALYIKNLVFDRRPEWHVVDRAQRRSARFSMCRQKNGFWNEIDEATPSRPIWVPKGVQAEGNFKQNGIYQWWPQMESCFVLNPCISHLRMF